MNMMMFARR